jgi:UDP-N-acetylglucosamine--N-acetylmuramyl-(pentapeptide) pyrophosphoryl-undecaprenol N-acetylglucosamine transferase
MKKIVLTGGGSAGHVTPNLALLPKLKNSFEIHYIGTNGIEKEIMKNQSGVLYHEISAVKLIRSFEIKNLLIPFKLLKAINESKKLLQEIKPNIVFSKGGFVAVPVVIAASQLKIPIVSHESDLTMGLANKIILTKCNVMCCSFEKTALTCGSKCVYSGTPIRQQLFKGNAEIALNECKFTNPNKPCLLVMGGSLGAKAINEVVVNSLSELTKTFNVIHIVGNGNLTNTINSSYYQTEYTFEIENFLALASIVISRAGSNSINEFLALKKPMLLIPLPKAQSRGDQILNAQEFAKHNFCNVLLQENLTPKTLVKEVYNLNANRAKFINAMSSAHVPNGVDNVFNLIIKYSK